MTVASFVPVGISCSRGFVAPLIVIYALENSWARALAVVAYCLFSDWFDGFIARRLRVKATKLNTAIDSIADALVSLAMVAGLYFTGNLPNLVLALMILLWWPWSLWRWVLTYTPVRKQVPRLYGFLTASRVLIHAGVGLAYMGHGLGLIALLVAGGILVFGFGVIYAIDAPTAIGLIAIPPDNTRHRQ